MIFSISADVESVISLQYLHMWLLKKIKTKRLGEKIYIETSRVPEMMAAGKDSFTYLTY